VNTSIKTANELRSLVEELLPNLSDREQRRFWQRMQDDPKNTAFKQFTDFHSKMFHKLCDVAKNLFDLSIELGNESVQLEKRAGPLLRKGKTPKVGRNDIIDNCLTVAGFAKDQVYRHLLTEHAQLMHVGKGKKSRPISEHSMWARHREWKATQENAG
jgi:hypothetical protein